jgi:A-factor biosynthesis hotdog domain
MRVVYVVGDRFEGFSDNSRVTTVRQFCKLAEVGGVTAGTRVILGQGVSRTSKQQIRSCLTASGLEASVNLVDHSSPKADRYLCHKHRPENSLVSIPRRVDETQFEMDLVIDDGCADLSDHVTGQHLQGMLLMEAARQAFLAVSEAYYGEGLSRYFVVNTMNVEYLNFAFPLPTLIRYDVDALERSRHGTLRFESTVTFVQCAREICRVQVVFSVYGTEYLERREALAAADSLQHYLNSLGHEPARSVALLAD